MMVVKKKQTGKRTLKEQVKSQLGDQSSFKFKPIYAVGLTIGFVLLTFNLLFLRDSPAFMPMFAVSFVVGTLLIWLDYFKKIKDERELEEKFPEFVRNLVEAIKSGLTVNDAIMHVSEIQYGSLTYHVEKLANQVSWAVPLHKALANFANSTGNKMIKRAVATIIEAKKAGGSLEDVLETITHSVVEIKKIKDKRRANIYSQVMQNYMIFFIFIGVMIVIQNVLMPYISNLGSGTLTGGADSTLAKSALEKNVQVDFSSMSSFIVTLSSWFLSLNGVFIMISIIQGFFAGIVIGKLSEGNIKYGFKHSFILVIIGFMMMSLAQGLAG